ncbi:finger 20 1 isoform X1 [Octopus vulgaris]|uniref:Finger 20 1 isoform X1 n=1 Tax=Octopus vulgaris TaxID=6645 RepID=A0AA36FN59_OCTVU|nr:finger 20 1 isoform X1 [Octopus vulgaris]
MNENGVRITRQSLSRTSSSDGAKDKNVPVKKKKLSTSSSESGYSVATSRSRRLPCRPGIVWRIGERLEAMDFIHKWYPAKIVNIQEEKFSVLIHFEGWNHRYDEWVDMKCERLRPASRRSERKEKRRQMTSYKVGEHVLAKWSDCKMYPAKVLAVKLPVGYEVLFYDGFKKLVQPSNVQTLPPDVKRMDPIPVAVPAATELPSTGGKDNQTEAKSKSENDKIPSEEEKESSPLPSTSDDDIISNSLTSTNKQAKKTKIIPDKDSTELKSSDCVIKERPASPVSAPPSSAATSVDPTTKEVEEPVDKMKEPTPPKEEPKTEPVESSEPPKIKELAEELIKPVTLQENTTEDKEKKKELIAAAEETATTAAAIAVVAAAAATSAAAAAPKPKEKKPNLFPNRRRQKLIVAGAFLAKRDASRKSPPSPAKKLTARAKPSIMKSEPSDKIEKDEKIAEKKVTSEKKMEKKLIPEKRATIDKKPAFREMKVHEDKRSFGEKKLDKRLSGERKSLQTPVAQSAKLVKELKTEVASETTQVKTERPMSEMKELEKALTIGFLPNSRPGMAPLSSAVTPSTAYVNMLTSTTNVFGGPVVSPTSTKPALGRKVRARPGRFRRGPHRASRKRGLSKSPDTSDFVVKKEPLSPGDEGLPRKRIKLGGKVASQEFTIQYDHNPYKCMFENCNKSFRKDHRLQYHIKYYHMEDSKAMVNSPVTVPSSKRQKTSSICSTSSDHSQKTKCDAVPPKRRYTSQLAPRHTLNGFPTLDSPSSCLLQDDIKNFDLLDAASEMVPPPITVKERKHDKRRRSKNIERPPVLEPVAEDFTEFEEEDTSSEVIHCVCNQVEEKGLMIQCEVCMCWQHAFCMNLDEATLPKKYICSICQNPRGLRPSAKYIYDQDWLKLGQLPGFSFVEADNDESGKINRILATNSLVGDLHNIIAVLYGIKRQVKLSLSSEKEGLKLWTKNWSTLNSNNTANTSHTEQECPEIRPTLSSFRVSTFVDPVLIDPQLPAEILADQQDSEADESGMVQDTGPTPASGPHPLTTNNCSPADQNHSGVDQDPGSQSKGTGLSSSSSSSLSTSSLSSSSSPSSSSSTSLPLKSSHLPNSGKISSLLKDSPNRTEAGSKKAGDSKKGQFVWETDKDEEPKPTVNNNNNNNSSSSKPPSVSGEGDSNSESTEDPGRENATEASKAATVDPLQDYQTNLLQYVMQTQREINHRLDSIGEQIDRLEDKEKITTPLSSDLPLLRKSLRSMMNDLSKVRKMAAYQ